MKNFKNFIVVVLCVFLCMPIFYGCGKQNNKVEAKQNEHIYNLDVKLNDSEKCLNVVENLTFNNFSNKDLTEIKLNVYPNAYRKGAKFKVVPEYQTDAYPNGESYGGIEILSVGEQIDEANYEICGDDSNILKIKLVEPLKSKNKILITITYNVTLANIRHRLGYADDVFTLANFYLSPCFLNADGTFYENHYYDYGDPFVENLAEFNVNFTCPRGFNVFSSGKETSVTENIDNTKTINLYSDFTRSFALVASKNLKSVSGSAENTNLTYAYLKDSEPRTSLGVFSNAYKQFSSTFGNLENSQMVVVEAPYSFGGMEFSNLVLVTSTALKDREEFNSIIVHELAHQWWYNAVGNNQVETPVLDEGLTEFSTMYYSFKTQGLTALRELATKNLSSHLLFLEVEKNMYDKVDETILRNLDGFKTGGEYSQIVYTRGSLMFYNLFELLGEKKFDKALKTYFKNNRYKTATMQNLIDAFNSVSKINLTAFFNNWLNGNVEISQV